MKLWWLTLWSVLFVTLVLGSRGQAFGETDIYLGVSKSREQLIEVAVPDFVVGDNVDAVLYNACIFLVPDYEEAIAATYDKLKEGGVIGMNYMLHMFDEDGTDLFKKAAEEGIAIAVETIQEIRAIEGVHGIHLMAIEWEEKVPEILERAGLLPRTGWSG